MRLTVCKCTALRLLRLKRCEHKQGALLRNRCNLSSPDPAPNKRWSKGRIESELRLLFGREMTGGELDLAVPSGAHRIRQSMVSNTIYAQGLPNGSFLRVDSNWYMSSPELLFVELANEMSLFEHLLLGYELCGGYSRDPFEPDKAASVMGLPPVTNVRAIGQFVDGLHNVRGTDAARQTLKFLSDNAWSPAESVVAAMFAMPLEKYGYGFGACELNKRLATPEGLKGAAVAGSRVPDIMIPGTNVGVNYDGTGHLDLQGIADAARKFDFNPGSSVAEQELQEKMGSVRGKVVEDVRRNRELAAQGLVVFPVVKEDLYWNYGLDNVVRQMMPTLCGCSGKKHDFLKDVLALDFASRERQALISSAFVGTAYRPEENDVVDAFVKVSK